MARASTATTQSRGSSLITIRSGYAPGMRRLLTALSITLLGCAYAAEDEAWDCSVSGSNDTTLKLIRAGADSRIIYDGEELP